MKGAYDLFQSCVATVIGLAVWLFSIAGIGWRFGPTVGLFYTVVTWCLIAAVGSSLEQS